MRIFLVLFSFLCLSGCVGLAVGTYGTFESQKDNFNLTDKRNQQGYGENTSYSKEHVISLWGTPDNITTKGSCDIFSYHDGYNWSGVGAFVVVVPIPLVIPSGADETKIYFKNNQSVKLVSEYGEITGMFGYMCGSNECGFKSGAVNTDKPRTVPVTWCE
ncbi:hypothetical protein [Thalassotalea maritima]|uniref:hypothetical protein n=1 Tax=Thalassotalea maritima TaxID=3242416 RepID=UPI003526E475